MTIYHAGTIVRFSVKCRHAGGYQHFRGIYCLHLAVISFHLKDEAVHSPDMLVPTYHNATYCHDPQKHNMNLHRLQKFSGNT